MTRLHTALVASLFLAVAACGKSPAPATEAPAAAEPAVAPAPAPAATPEVTAEVAAPAAEAAAKAVTESAGTPTEAAGAPLGKEIVLPEPAPAAPTAFKYQEGPHYRVLPAAQGTSSSPEKIEVAEVFWYGCPHCYDLEPVIEDWAKRQPADVSFVQIPVLWSPAHEIHARIFYTAQALGKLDQMHPAIFRAFHIEQKQLQNEDEIREFFGKFGVSAEDFNKTYRSFAVDSQLQRAKTLMARYRVKSVPLLVVNGKYVTDGPEVRSRDDQLALVDELILRERQSR